MRFDPKNPQNPDNDRFVLSKGHAAPILYAAWAHAGLFPRAELLKLRRFDSDLEGHPTPRLSFVDVATGSLGQGICAGVGTALNARRIKSDYRTYVLLGDGEMAEGSVWEAASVALLSQARQPLRHRRRERARPEPAHAVRPRMDEIAARWSAFGWHTLTVDGHDVEALLHAFAAAKAAKHHPTMILARTLKGKGVASVEGKDGWHGKAFKKGEEADKAVAELKAQLVTVSAVASSPAIPAPSAKPREAVVPDYSKMPPPDYKPGEQVATREAWGTALAALGGVDPRVVALDADVKNSTFSDRFEKAHPDRFYEFFIAEQAMVGAAMGLAARGAIAFPSTFACFLTRASDFIRMAGISNARLSSTSSWPDRTPASRSARTAPRRWRSRISAMMRAVPNCAVLYPCDAVSTERLVVEMAQRTTAWPTCARRGRRPPIIYGLDEQFPIGGSKVLHQSDNDVATVVAPASRSSRRCKAYEQLKARRHRSIRVIDAYSVQPIDAATLHRRGQGDQRCDHHRRGSLRAGGLGDAVSEAVAPAGLVVHRLAVREIAAQRPAGRAPRSLRHFRQAHRRRRATVVLRPACRPRASHRRARRVRREKTTMALRSRRARVKCSGQRINPGPA